MNKILFSRGRAIRACRDCLRNCRNTLTVHTSPAQVSFISNDLFFQHLYAEETRRDIQSLNHHLLGVHEQLRRTQSIALDTSVYPPVEEPRHGTQEVRRRVTQREALRLQEALVGRSRSDPGTSNTTRVRVEGDLASSTMRNMLDVRGNWNTISIGTVNVFQGHIDCGEILPQLQGVISFHFLGLFFLLCLTFSTIVYQNSTCLQQGTY